MLRADRICIWIFILGLLFLIPSMMFIKFADELCVASLAGVAVLDAIVNGNWRRYRLLWVIVAIMTFYAIYSAACFSFNTLSYILVDWVIELKPYIPWVVFFAVNPSLYEKDRQLLRCLCVLNIGLSFLIMLGGYSLIVATIGHIAMAGHVIFICSLIYAYCSIDSHGNISKSTLITIFVFFTAGLLCARSKYYVEYVVAVYFFIFYHPGILKNFKMKHLIGVLSLCILIIAVSWNKFSYYYLTGNNDSFDPTAVQTFARPVLYATGGLILIDFFPFGSGLASFATYASAANYSDLYFYYGIDKVYGLSPQMGEFICDAFLPSLAQFGIVGLSLFIWFWAYVYNYVRPLAHSAMINYKYTIAIASLIIVFIWVESTSGTAITMQSGMIAMSLLGLICGKSEYISENEHLKSSKKEHVLEQKIQIEKI